MPPRFFMVITGGGAARFTSPVLARAYRRCLLWAGIPAVLRPVL